MRKLLLVVIFGMLISMVSCSSIKRESAVFERVNSKVESSVLADDGHYEVILLLENGEKFTYHSKDDVNLLKEKREINMGYNRESKTYLLAVINPEN